MFLIIEQSEFLTLRFSHVCECGHFRTARKCSLLSSYGRASSENCAVGKKTWHIIPNAGFKIHELCEKGFCNLLPRKWDTARFLRMKTLHKKS